jgi:mannose-1-phosphate guanylyltransferase
VSDKDNAGNVVAGDALLHETKNSYVRADDKPVTTVGVEDLVIVSTKDAVLVAHKVRAQDAKTIAAKLKSESRSEWDFHREVYRPWEKYDLIDIGMGFRLSELL